MATTQKIYVEFARGRFVASGIIQNKSGEELPAIFSLDYRKDTKDFIDFVMRFTDTGELVKVPEGDIVKYVYDAELHLNHQLDEAGWVEELPTEERYRIV